MRSPSNLLWATFFKDSLISLSAATKLVPLSERISLTCPLRFKHRMSASMKSSVSSDLANSSGTSQKFRHTMQMKTPQRFSATFPCPHFMKWSAIIHSTIGPYGVSRTFRKSPICWFIFGPICFLL